MKNKASRRGEVNWYGEFELPAVRIKMYLDDFEFLLTFLTIYL